MWRICWDKIPKEMRTAEVLYYYKALSKNKLRIFIKRLFDLLLASLLLVVLAPLMILIAIVIKAESKGPVLFCQTRVTHYRQNFKIFKFRTMHLNSDAIGFQITLKDDPRITGVGALLRKYRLDELPQLFNIIAGTMSIVGTRPEVPRYVEKYSNEMLATLLLPAGITSEASIKFKDEESLLQRSKDVEEVYSKTILPLKMEYNLKYLVEFSILKDLKIIFNTLTNVLFAYFKVKRGEKKS